MGSTTAAKGDRLLSTPPWRARRVANACFDAGRSACQRSGGGERGSGGGGSASTAPRQARQGPRRRPLRAPPFAASPRPCVARTLQRAPRKRRAQPTPCSPSTLLRRVVDPPWEAPGIDLSDFFNYDLNPDTWKDYCAEIHRFRMEFSMQNRIHRVDTGAGRAPVFVDPDLPPELRAAVAAQRFGGGPRGPLQFAVRKRVVWGCGVWGF